MPSPRKSTPLLERTADPTNSGSKFALDGRTYFLCFDHSAMHEAECRLANAEPEVSLLYELPRLSISTARILFASALSAFHPEISFGDGVGLVSGANAGIIVQAILAAWRDSMPPPAQAGQSTGYTPPPRKEAWLQRWAFARIDLQMGLAEFLGTTPRQFEALRRRHEAKEKEAGNLFELMMAQQAALTFNTRMTYAKEPRAIAEFMPSKWTEKPAEKPQRKRSKSGMPVVCEQFATILKMHGVTIVKGH